MPGQVAAFPDTYRALTTEVLVATYEAGPGRLHAVLEGLTDDDLHARPRPGNKWSILQIVVHLSDAELMGALRVRLAYGQSGSTLPVYDQDLWASALRYQETDRQTFERRVELFTLLRETTTPIFRQARDAEWTQRAAQHPEFGPVTLRNLLELYADHGERHIEQIVAIRELLGKGLDFPPLIEVRLY